MGRDHRITSFGGQKRTYLTPCGKTFQGTPREATNKIKIHKKYCEMCVKIDIGDCEEFNTKWARHNGWNNLNGYKVVREHLYTFLKKT